MNLAALVISPCESSCLVFVEAGAELAEISLQGGTRKKKNTLPGLEMPAEASRTLGQPADAASRAAAAHT